MVWYLNQIEPAMLKKAKVHLSKSKCNPTGCLKISKSPCKVKANYVLIFWDGTINTKIWSYHPTAKPALENTSPSISGWATEKNVSHSCILSKFPDPKMSYNKRCWPRLFHECSMVKRSNLKHHSRRAAQPLAQHVRPVQRVIWPLQKNGSPCDASAHCWIKMWVSIHGGTP